MKHSYIIEFVYLLNGFIKTDKQVIRANSKIEAINILLKTHHILEIININSQY